MIRINKNIVTAVAWSLTAVAIVVLLGFTGHRQSIMPCSGLEVKVVDATGNFFIEPVDITNLLNSKGSKLKGKPMNEIDLNRIEKIVYSNPFVDRAEVYAGMNGKVYIDVWQRNPVIRVINVANEHFYIDENGNYFPVSDKYSNPVIVANGFIKDSYVNGNIGKAVEYPGDTTIAPVVHQLNHLAWYLRNHPEWDAQIDQIYVNEHAEIELIPRIGDQRILLGTTDDLELKMNNLMTFYKEGVIRKGWDKYSVINLKFKNQVICTKAGNRTNI